LGAIYSRPTDGDCTTYLLMAKWTLQPGPPTHDLCGAEHPGPWTRCRQYLVCDCHHPARPVPDLNWDFFIQTCSASPASTQSIAGRIRDDRPAQAMESAKRTVRYRSVRGSRMRKKGGGEVAPVSRADRAYLAKRCFAEPGPRLGLSKLDPPLGSAIPLRKGYAALRPGTSISSIVSTPHRHRAVTPVDRDPWPLT